MVFLDTTKKAWVIKKLEIPVIEDVPMKDLQWFKDKSKEAMKKQEDGTITQLEALDYDEAWWDQLCKVGLKTTKKKILDTGISEPQFRELMAELYHFLAVCGNVEGAMLSPLYSVETLKNEKSQ